MTIGQGKHHQQKLLPSAKKQKLPLSAKKQKPPSFFKEASASIP